MKYVFIEKHQAEFSIQAMCRVLRVARSGWYAWRNRCLRVNARQQFRLSCDAAVSTAFHQAKQRYSASCLADEFRAWGQTFNVKTVAASLRWQRLRAKASRRFNPVSYRGWSMSSRMTAQLACDALQMPLWRRKRPENVNETQHTGTE